MALIHDHKKNFPVYSLYCFKYGYTDCPFLVTVVLLCKLFILELPYIIISILSPYLSCAGLRYHTVPL